MINFLKQYFFFKISKAEKKKVRQYVLEDDHKLYGSVLLIVALLQLIMLVISLVQNGFSYPDPKVLTYRILYIALAVYCLLAYFITRLVYKLKDDLFYFAIISISLVAICLWSVGISILDSANSANYSNIITFTYTTIALSSFMIIEPWIMAIDLGCSTIALNLAIYFIPITHDSYDPNLLINSISVFILTVIISSFNFKRRISKIKISLEINELNDALIKKASFDALTNLYNRRYLVEKIDDKINFGDHPTGVMMLDLDHFKDVNDTYGHQAGDYILSEFGKVIAKYVQGEGSYAVRYGGEEFLVYYDRATSEKLFNIAEEIRVELEKTKFIYKDNEMNLTVSIGVAVATNDISYAGLINKADLALYEAKQTRNKTVVK